MAVRFWKTKPISHESILYLYPYSLASVSVCVTVIPDCRAALPSNPSCRCQCWMCRWLCEAACRCVRLRTCLSPLSPLLSPLTCCTSCLEWVFVSVCRFTTTAHITVTPTVCILMQMLVVTFYFVVTLSVFPSPLWCKWCRTILAKLDENGKTWKDFVNIFQSLEVIFFFQSRNNNMLKEWWGKKRCSDNFYHRNVHWAIIRRHWEEEKVASD